MVRTAPRQVACARRECRRTSEWLYRRGADIVADDCRNRAKKNTPYLHNFIPMVSMINDVARKIVCTRAATVDR